MTSKINNIWLGLVLGLIVPWIVMLIYYRINYYYLSANDFLYKTVFMERVFVPLLSLCVLGNLLAFFLFIWTDKLLSARGVLFATILYAIAVFAIKLLQ